MATQGRTMNPEDEYLARRSDTQPSIVAPQARAQGRASKIIGTVSTAMKALFGIRRTRRPRHA